MQRAAGAASDLLRDKLRLAVTFMRGKGGRGGRDRLKAIAAQAELAVCWNKDASSAAQLKALLAAAHDQDKTEVLVEACDSRVAALDTANQDGQDVDNKAAEQGNSGPTSRSHRASQDQS
jgi:hypothetical protein